jgi:hypothetical protein
MTIKAKAKWVAWEAWEEWAVWEDKWEDKWVARWVARWAVWEAKWVGCPKCRECLRWATPPSWLLCQPSTSLTPMLSQKLKIKKGHLTTQKEAKAPKTSSIPTLSQRSSWADWISN